MTDNEIKENLTKLHRRILNHPSFVQAVSENEVSALVECKEMLEENNVQAIRDKAIDEFKSACVKEITDTILQHKDQLSFAAGLSYTYRILDKVAEQMEGGEE